MGLTTACQGTVKENKAMTELVARPDGQWVDAVPVYYSRAWGTEGSSGRVDGDGNSFLATLFHKKNASIIYIRKVAPNGTVLDKWNVVFQGCPHDANPDNTAWDGTGKVDGFDIYPSGSNLHVKLSGHVTNAQRDNLVNMAVLQGVYTPHTGTQPEDGRAGAYAPAGGEPDPEPGGEPVDYERIEAIVEFQVQAGIAALVEQYGGGSVRGGIMEKVQDGVRDLFVENPPAGSRARVFQERFFPYVRNANAGVWANILGGVDDWNRARRDELKQVIREVLEEGIPDEPTTDGQEG